MKLYRCLFILLAAIFSANLSSQQVSDTLFNPEIKNPEYPFGSGPLVMIDEGHNNFHTAEGRYFPFARLLRADGYNVDNYTGEFKKGKLKNVRILVVANALNRINIENWWLPTPSAFTEEEIRTLQKWISDGGSLFLIADHMPMGGAAESLAATFGFRFTNGFAADTSTQGPAFFYRKDSTLLPSCITDGRNPDEYVSKVVTFTGQGFPIPDSAIPVLRFDKRYLLLESDTAWVFNSHTKYTPIGGWSQGACMKYGKGRLAMFGEAAMFTAQLAGPAKVKIGMNSEYAEDNFKLLLNVIHWLDRKIND